MEVVRVRAGSTGRWGLFGAELPPVSTDLKVSPLLRPMLLLALRLRLLLVITDVSVTSTPMRFSTGEARSSKSSIVDVIEGNVACLCAVADERVEEAPAPASVPVGCGPRGNVLDLDLEDLDGEEGIRGDVRGVFRRLVEEVCVRRDDAEKDVLSGDRGGELECACRRGV